MSNRRLLDHAIMALVLVMAMAPQAKAGIWAWGCASATQDGEQIIFNRDVLLMLDRPSELGLKAIVINSDGLEQHPARERFNALDFNSGFETTLRFRTGPERPAAASDPTPLEAGFTSQRPRRTAR